MLLYNSYPEEPNPEQAGTKFATKTPRHEEILEWRRDLADTFILNVFFVSSCLRGRYFLSIL